MYNWPFWEVSCLNHFGKIIDIANNDYMVNRYDIVEGNHNLWKGVSKPYRETIRAFLAYFQDQVCSCFVNLISQFQLFLDFVSDVHNLLPKLIFFMQLTLISFSIFWNFMMHV